MSLTVNALLRADLQDFAGYKSARSEALTGAVWLNANESAWANAGDAGGQLRRYPQPQPQALCARLAELYGVAPAQLLVGRGSDEGIDLLLRAFCPPGQGKVVLAPPVFGMYAVCARLHGAHVIEVLLRDGAAGLCADLAALGDAALAQGASLLFLCTPGNPSGELLALAEVAALAQRLRGRCLVIVDEAYLEYAEAPSAASLLAAHDNIAVLRTLSKAHALAGARVGCVLGSPALIAALRRCQVPYPIPEPVVEAALRSLQPAAVAASRAQVRDACALREQVRDALQGLPQVRRVYPSAGNFVLARFFDADAVFAALLAAGVVVRDMRALPQLGDALRISIGTAAECGRLFAALGAAVEVSP